MVVVKVRQRTLWIAGRSWTRRTRRTRRRTTRRRRRGGGDEEERRRRGEEQATDIKSNNPHLAGGEKPRPSANYPMHNGYECDIYCRKRLNEPFGNFKHVCCLAKCMDIH